jgi:hypothetical protein
VGQVNNNSGKFLLMVKNLGLVQVETMIPMEILIFDGISETAE